MIEDIKAHVVWDHSGPLAVFTTAEGAEQHASKAVHAEVTTLDIY